MRYRGQTLRPKLVRINNAVATVRVKYGGPTEAFRPEFGNRSAQGIESCSEPRGSGKLGCRNQSGKTSARRCVRNRTHVCRNFDAGRFGNTADFAGFFGRLAQGRLATEWLAKGRTRNGNNRETNQTNDADCELTTHKPTVRLVRLPIQPSRRSATTTCFVALTFPSLQRLVTPYFIMLVDVQSPRVVGSNTELPSKVTLISGANFTSESAKNFRPQRSLRRPSEPQNRIRRQPERSRFSGGAKDLPLNRPIASAKLHQL